jgi:RNA polymerase sigma-70 factor (ECF subfamily)
VLQDIYTYIWVHAAEYRDERGTPKARLSMLARSRALDRLRLTRRASVALSFDDQILPRVCVGSSPESAEIWQRSLVETGMRELSTDQRRLIDMAFFDGLSHSEIADRTGAPLGTVKTRIRAALTRMRGKMPVRTGLPRAA